MKKVPHRNLRKKGFTPDNPLSEDETRKKYFDLAKSIGCERELFQIFQRYDGLLRNCSNPIERHQIAVLANVEVHKLFMFRDPLIVRGQEILPGDPNWKGEV